MFLSEIKINLRKNESFCLEGPSTISVNSGRIDSLGIPFHPGDKIVVPEFKSLPFTAVEDCDLHIKLRDEKLFTTISESLPSGWLELGERLKTRERPFKIVVIGDVDSGKTTLTTYLSNVLTKGGVKVAVIDADTGQKDLGPPATVGMKILEDPVLILSEIEEDYAVFVGSTSPSGILERSVSGVLRLVEEAVSHHAEAILINTTGWVYGRDARELKSVLLFSLNPEYLVAIQRSDELEHLLKPFHHTSMEIIRVSPSKNVRSRSRNERRKLRERRFRRYFRGARTLNLSMEEVRLAYSYLGSGRCLDETNLTKIKKTIGAEPLHCEEAEDFILVVLDEKVPLDDKKILELERLELGKEIKTLRKAHIKNLLCGSLNRENRFLALSILEDVEFKSRMLKIFTKAVKSEIAVIQLGSIRVNRQGKEEGWVGVWYV